MFKVKTVNIDKQIVLDKLKIFESKEYEYVITDDISGFEKGKINIIFDIEQLPKITQIIKGIILGEEYYINIENSKGIKRVDVRKIEYFEANDNDVFAVLGKERFYVLDKLYMLESKLDEKNFVRVSKSFLVNIASINYIRPILNYKLKLIMNNGDIIEVNRTYTKSFKERIRL